MAVRINGPVPPGNVGRPQSRPGAKKSEESVSSESRSEKVDLSEKQGALSVAKAATRDVSDVDETKVAELRQKIASGEYRADLRIVAERLIAEAVQFDGT